MAINNSTNRVFNLTTNGIAYAVSAKELDTLALAQGHFLSATSSGVPTSVQLVGQNGIVVDATSTAGVVNISAPAPQAAGITWQAVATSTTVAPRQGYVVNATTSIVLTLPAPGTAAIGDEYEIIGAGGASATYTITAPAGATIMLGDTTSAVAGSAVSTLNSDAARIVYVGNDNFSIVHSTGNFNVA